MKRYKPGLTRVGDEVRPVMIASADGAWVSIVELDDWMEQNDIVGWQGEKKIERLQRELSAAREAVGEGWFTGGATLAEAIRRKVHVLECERENRLADKHPPAPGEGPEGGAR